MAQDVVVDTAGGGIGGAARWRSELDAFLERGVPGVKIVGRGRPLTPSWLLRREWLAGRARVVVATNNASFACRGGERRVLLRNALHFLRPSEDHMLRGMPRAFRAQIPLVRRLLGRADLIVVPCTTMAERVSVSVPSAAKRIVVHAHPVTPAGARTSSPRPFILVPVVPAPYKNLGAELAALVATLDKVGGPMEVWVTARPGDLPGTLARHPRLTMLGVVPYHRLATMWRHATAAFYPSSVEAFGYPLAEARVYGLPVLAPDSAQAREIAGRALVAYQAGRLGSLEQAVRQAVQAAGRPVEAEPRAFERGPYFRWLLGLPADLPIPTVQESHGIPS
ncbi:glycosyltransferase [Phytoactinopolyspora halotolerans]|uniref:Glycosyltransferase family 4 protein n=1 Tax=Phytoactinopolyspora halotolerans TaxID=1981512 RepID=A0A6L9S4V2_9ACTN|nr:glycosyltransferase [Phytoactinopolyspora halotolerans]NEE00186.1 glycosyltransferase family 4 protein [Phytoactinopolyspora halotolerans]